MHEYDNSTQQGELSMESQLMPKNLIVVGVPRSGTSLTTAIFGRKGYYVGRIDEQRVREGDDDNPFGYFEGDDVIARNVEVFHRAGFGGHNTWLREMISEESIVRIAQMEPSEEHRRFVESYQVNAPWVWKDPRLNLTLAYWWKLMDPTTTGVVLVQRDPAQVFRSFQRMGWVGNGKVARKKAFQRIERHIRAAQEAIESLQIPHITVNYQEYFSEPDEVAHRLGGFCGLDLSVEELNARPDLNHSSLRGRISARLRMSIDRGPLRHARVVRALVPRCLLTVLLPEKKYRSKK